MYGLPEKTECRIALPKDKVISSQGLKGAERERFDQQIHKITILNIISSETLNVQDGTEIHKIYVIEIQLNEMSYDERILDALNRMGHKAVYVLLYGEKSQLAAFDKLLFKTDWMEENNISIELSGLTLDGMWENIVRRIGNLHDGGDFKDTIDTEAKNRKILDQISKLESKLAKEKQNHKQRELFAQIQELRKELV